MQRLRDIRAAVIFAGLPDVMESEGYDRKDMKMPACQNKLIEVVAKVQPNTVVVLHNGSPIEAPWADDVAAVLEMYLGGQGVGEACDSILFGETNPSGRLAETFPYHLEDNPSYLNFPGDGQSVNYAEDIYVGYRYYEKKHIPVRWAFGHGLSYTTFAYNNLKLSSDSLDDAGTITVSVDVTNTGKVAGKEVVQLYVSDKNGTPQRPVKELKGFQKVSLEAGETKTVALTINARDLSYYHEGLGDWYAPFGTYELLIGHASDEILLTADIQFSTKKQLPLYVTGATTLGELLADTRTAPVVAQMMEQAKDMMPMSEESSDNALGTDKEMMQAMMTGMPLKSLISFGGAAVGAQIEGMIETLNNLLK